MECWLGSVLIFRRFGPSITKKPYSFVISQEGGGGSGPPVPSFGSMHDTMALHLATADPFIAVIYDEVLEHRY